MCRNNTPERCENTPLTSLRRGKNTRLNFDGCASAQIAVYRHLVRYQATLQNCDEVEFTKLLKDLNCYWPDTDYPNLVHQRVKRFIRRKFTKLKDLGVVEVVEHHNGGVDAVYAPYTKHWLRQDWKGDIGDPSNKAEPVDTSDDDSDRMIIDDDLNNSFGTLSIREEQSPPPSACQTLHLPPTPPRSSSSSSRSDHRKRSSLSSNSVYSPRRSTPATPRDEHPRLISLVDNSPASSYEPSIVSRAMPPLVNPNLAFLTQTSLLDIGRASSYEPTVVHSTASTMPDRGLEFRANGSLVSAAQPSSYEATVLASDSASNVHHPALPHTISPYPTNVSSPLTSAYSLNPSLHLAPRSVPPNIPPTPTSGDSLNPSLHLASRHAPPNTPSSLTSGHSLNPSRVLYNDYAVSCIEYRSMPKISQLREDMHEQSRFNNIQDWCRTVPPPDNPIQQRDAAYARITDIAGRLAGMENEQYEREVQQIKAALVALDRIEQEELHCSRDARKQLLETLGKPAKLPKLMSEVIQEERVYQEWRRSMIETNFVVEAKELFAGGSLIDILMPEHFS